MVARRTGPTRRPTDLSDLAWSILTDRAVQPPEPEEQASAWEHFGLVWDAPGVGPSLADVWREHADAVLPGWIAERPGTRPKCWWLFDAPNRSNQRQFYASFEAPEPTEQTRLLADWGLLISGERQRLGRRAPK